MDLLAPIEMRELYQQPGRGVRMNGIATYGHFRQFQVSGSSPNSPVKADKALVASTLSYATSSSFIGTAIVARSVCSCRNIAAVIGMPRQCFDAVMRLA